MENKFTISDIDKYFARLDRLYPNRRKQIHKVPCKGCPSADTRIDLESQDIKDTCSKEFLAKEGLFVCYKRESKLCKGLCDFMEIDQDFLDNFHAANSKTIRGDSILSEQPF